MVYIFFALIIIIIFFIVMYMSTKPNFVYRLFIIALPLRNVKFNIGFDIRIIDILIFIFFISILVNILFNKIDKIKIKEISLIFIFSLYSILSITWSVDKAAALEESIRLLLVLLLFLCVYIFNTNIGINNIKKYLKFSIYITFIICMLTIFNIIIKNYETMLLNPISILNNTKVLYKIKFDNSVFFEDPNNYASYLLLNIFLTFYCKNVFNSKQYKVILSTLFVGLALTFSRSIYIALVLTLILIYLNSIKINKISLFRFSLLIIFVVGIFFLIPVIYNYVINDQSFLSRFGFMKTSMKIIYLKFLLGTGIGNYGYYFEILKDSSVWDNPYTHNLFLKLFTELGYIGITLFLLYTLILVKKLIKVSIYDKRTLFLMYGIIAYLIQNMVVEFFTAKHYWFYLAIYASIITVYDKPITKENNNMKLGVDE